MSEIRHDFLLPRWVIIAENRAERPNEFVAPQPQRHGGSCPFCPGHEAQTATELLVRRGADWSGDQSDWRVRVVANLYPAVEVNASAGERHNESSPDTGSSFRADSGFGHHEVVIDTPRHVLSLGELTDEDVVLLFDVYRDRVAAIRDMAGINSALVFKNVGAAAGASIEHAHSQILATPRPAFEVEREWQLSREFYKREGVCPFCRMRDEELAAAARIVEQNELAVAVCPFASRFPYETWILPRRHESHFETGEDDMRAAVATMTRRAIARLERVLARPAYNLVIHSAPFDNGASPHYDWRVELYPRITPWAGFEVGGGNCINSVAPERAVAQLRDAF